MPNQLKKIVIIFDDNGIDPPTIQREYKTVLHEGEGAPRDVEITAEERLSIYSATHAVSTAIFALERDARVAAESLRDSWKADAEQLKAEKVQMAAEHSAQVKSLATVRKALEDQLQEAKTARDEARSELAIEKAKHEATRLAAVRPATPE